MQVSDCATVSVSLAAPSAVSIMHQVSRTVDSITLSWSQPDQPNGVILDYELQYYEKVLRDLGRGHPQPLGTGGAAELHLRAYKYSLAAFGHMGDSGHQSLGSSDGSSGPSAENPLVIQELLLSPPQNWWQVGPLQGEQGSQAQGCIFAFSPSGASIGNGNDREHPVPGWSILSDVQSWRFSGVLPMGAFTPKVSLASLQHPEPRCCAGRRCPPIEGAV